METNDKEPAKKKKAAQDHIEHEEHHSSHGHSTGAESTAASEPNLRSATTDSSRAPKSSNDEGPTGGTVR